jgi:hypothetical protein
VGRDKRASRAGREAGPFLALPHAVLDSPAFQALSMHARALLLEMGRQLSGHNNGGLLCSRAYMGTRGWNSADMLTKAKRELLAAGFLHETVMGQRPNKASWYAVTWCSLDKLQGLDPGAAQTFVRGAYNRQQPQAKAKPAREDLYAKWNGPSSAEETAP